MSDQARDSPRFRLWRRFAVIVASTALASCGSSSGTSSTASTTSQSLNEAQRAFVAWAHAFIGVKQPETAAIAASARFNAAKSSGSLSDLYRRAATAEHAWRTLQAVVADRLPRPALGPARPLDATYRRALALLVAGYQEDERGMRTGGNVGASEAKSGEAKIARAGVLLRGLGAELVRAYTQSGGMQVYGPQLLAQLDARAK